MIPIGYDFTGARVLIVGGGSVGARKARTFAREAETIVLSPAFADRSFGDAHLVRTALEPADLDDWVGRVEPTLVVAATDDEAINDAAARAGRAAGALVNRADRSDSETARRTDADRTTARPAEPTHEVTTLATIRDEPVVVGVSTGGTAPALAGELRRRIEPQIAGAGAMADLLGELRLEAKRRGDPAERRAAMRAIARSPAVWKGLRTGTSNARTEARRLLDQHV